MVTRLMTSSPKMWHEKIFYGKCYLVVVWHSSTYTCQSKLSKNIASKDSGLIFMIIIIYFYNYYYSPEIQWCLENDDLESDNLENDDLKNEG